MTVSDALWMINGNCHPNNTNSSGADWFADAGTIQCEAAVTICKACPVCEKCLQFAIATEEMFGVWGGLTPAQRDALRRGVSREQALRIRRTRSRRSYQNGSSAGTARL